MIAKASLSHYCGALCVLWRGAWDMPASERYTAFGLSFNYIKCKALRMGWDERRFLFWCLHWSKALIQFYPTSLCRSCHFLVHSLGQRATGCAIVNGCKLSEVLKKQAARELLMIPLPFPTRFNDHLMRKLAHLIAYWPYHRFS